MNIDFSGMSDLDIIKHAELHYGLNHIEEDVESDLGIWLYWNKSNQDFNPVKIYYRPNHPRAFEHNRDLQEPITTIPKPKFLSDIIDEVIMYPHKDWYTRYHQYLVEVVNLEGEID